MVTQKTVVMITWPLIKNVIHPPGIYNIVILSVVRHSIPHLLFPLSMQTI